MKKVIKIGNYSPSGHNASSIVDTDGISPTVMENHGTVTAIVEPCTPNYRIRKLTPRECFRLMGVEDADIDKLLSAGISNTQLLKCAGNSIVVDTLYHIFRKAFIDTGNENQQQTLF
ncbi:MAG: DNA cytosine methyltransferase [Paludibacteraceae bacterium]|nr:DNA cytosine methyltransferase [Paludibacteraceae bacterium]